MRQINSLRFTLIMFELIFSFVAHGTWPLGPDNANEINLESLVKIIQHGSESEKTALKNHLESRPEEIDTFLKELEIRHGSAQSHLETFDINIRRSGNEELPSAQNLINAVRRLDQWGSDMYTIIRFVGKSSGADFYDQDDAPENVKSSRLFQRFRNWEDRYFENGTVNIAFEEEGPALMKRVDGKPTNVPLAKKTSSVLEKVGLAGPRGWTVTLRPPNISEDIGGAELATPGVGRDIVGTGQ